MSQANVEVVRQAFEVREYQGVEAALQFFASDVVWYATDRWLECATFRGHEGLLAADALWAAEFDDFGWAVHDIRDAGERVVALSEMTGRIKGSGVRISAHAGLVVSDIHDRMLGAIRVYSSRDEALKAVGLEGATRPPQVRQAHP